MRFNVSADEWNTSTVATAATELRAEVAHIFNVSLSAVRVNVTFPLTVGNRSHLVTVITRGRRASDNGVANTGTMTLTGTMTIIIMGVPPDAVTNDVGQEVLSAFEQTFEISMVDPDIDVIFSNATLPREYDGSSSNGALFPLALAAVGVVAILSLSLNLRFFRGRAASCKS